MRTMKTGAVCLCVWFAQVLTLCALHENLLTTHELDLSMATPEGLTTRQDDETKISATAKTTTVTSAEELLSDLTSSLTHTPGPSGLTSSLEDDERNKTISTSRHNITSLTENIVSTNTTSVETERRETRTGTEGTSITFHGTSEISTSGTSTHLHRDVQTTTSSSWTGDGTSDNHEANATMLLPVYSTSETDATLTRGSHDTTARQSPAVTTTSPEIPSTNQSRPNDTANPITPTGTAGTVTLPTTLHSTELTSGSTESTEEPPASSTEMMDWTTQENTEALTTSQTDLYHTTYSTRTEDAGSAVTEEAWSAANTTTSTNISTSGTEAPRWTNCFTANSSPQSRRVSKLVCFVTLWSLGMVASVFLGLTVFLWVRLSVTRKRARLRGRGVRDRKGKGPAVKEKESLWAESGSSTEERVEFWYANGDMVEKDKRKHNARQVRMRKDGERLVGTEEDMWIQPKVTLKDITEFWYTNGRVRHTEETPCELHEE